MKKMIIALMCAIGGMTTLFATNVTNVYNMSMSLKTPTLFNGVRSVTAQQYKGYMYIEHEDSEVVAVWAEVTSSKTKVTHVITFTDGFYNLMGKSSKTCERSTPTVYLAGADDCVYGGTEKYGVHETIKTINLAGFGVLKSSKTVTIGCQTCGVVTKDVSYCNILNSANGTVTGVMDCECPEDVDWWHTVKAGLCGIWYNSSDEYERTHDASFNGTWKVSYNSKLSK